MENNTEQKPNESFKNYMDRILREARKRYDSMSSEDQRLLDEAAQRLGERVHSEIMASFPVGFENGEAKPNEDQAQIEALEKPD